MSKAMDIAGAFRGHEARRARRRRMGASVAAGALSVGALLSAGVPASATSRSVTVTFWNEMTGPYGVALAGEIRQFERANPGITVDSVTIPNDAALEPKLLAAIVGHQEPTLSQMNPPWGTGFIHTGSLVNLSPHLAKTSSMSPSNFYASLLEGGRWPDGRQYLFPFNVTTAIMFYNKTAFAKAGITAPPKTWQQFTADAAKMSGGSRRAFAITLVHSYPWLAFFYQAGGNFILRDGKPNPAAFTLNGPAGKALSLWATMVKRREAVLTQGYASQTDFADGTSSILVGTSAFYPYLAQAVGHKFTIGVAPLPNNVQEATSIFGGYLGMFSQATPAQRSAAFKFIEYLTSVQGTTYWANHSQGYLPVRPSVVKSDASFLATHPAQRVSLEALPTGKNPPKVAWWDQFSHQVLLNTITAVLIGKETVAGALRSAYHQAVELANRNGTYQ